MSRPDPKTGYRRTDMEITSESMIDRDTEIQREHIHAELLKEAIKGLTDLKAGRTISLDRLKSRHDR
jgi:hypothetical protein